MDETRERPTVLSVVIPAYNEEDGIAEIVDRVLATRPALAEVDIGLELIVVDDGSSDRTSEIASTRSEVMLICHPINRGYGAALKTGFSAASGELLAFLDADGTYPPEHFPDLCRYAMGEADLVVGSRRSGADSEMPFVRRLGNLLWSGLVTVLSGHRVIDPASGMRVFRREVLERLYPLPDGLNLTPVMSTRAIHEGVRLLEVPIPYKERLGRSKLNVVRDGMLFLQTIIWTALNYNPVRLLGGLGVGLGALSALVVVTLLGLRLAGVTRLGPWGVTSAFAMVVFAIVGLDLFSLGVTFNYLVSLFHKRPIRQGLFGRPIFRVPLDRQFWWMGILAVVVGVILGGVSLYLGLVGWPIERLWLYLLGGTMCVLVGVQLVIFWIIVRVLDELSQREVLVKADMECLL